MIFMMHFTGFTSHNKITCGVALHIGLADTSMSEQNGRNFATVSNIFCYMKLFKFWWKFDIGSKRWNVQYFCIGACIGLVPSKRLELLELMLIKSRGHSEINFQLQRIPFNVYVRCQVLIYCKGYKRRRMHDIIIYRDDVIK